MPRTKKTTTTVKNKMSVNTLDNIDQALDGSSPETEQAIHAPELSETVYYMDINTLRDNFANQSMQYSRNKYYMRKGEFNLEPTDPNIIEKNKALYNFETGKLQVLEPIVFETVRRGDRVVQHLISGNSRVKCLLTAYAYKEIRIPVEKEGKLQSIKLTKDNFADIPFREFNTELSDLDFIKWQTNTNDFTKKHNTVEIALTMAELKKPKAEGGLELSDKQLAELFGRSKANVGQLLKFANCDNEQLRQLVIDGKMNTDTASKIVSATTTKTSPLYNYPIETVLESLKTIAKGYTGAEDGVIYLKYLKEFKDTIDDGIPTRPPNTDDLGGSPNGSNPPTDTHSKPPGGAGGGGGKKDRKVTSLEEFEDVPKRVDKEVSSINCESINPDKTSDLHDIAILQLKKLEVLLIHVENSPKNSSIVWELISEATNRISDLDKAYEKMTQDDNSRTTYSQYAIRQKKHVERYLGTEIEDDKSSNNPDKNQESPGNKENITTDDLIGTASSEG